MFDFFTKTNSELVRIPKNGSEIVSAFAEQGWEPGCVMATVNGPRDEEIGGLFQGFTADLVHGETGDLIETAGFARFECLLTALSEAEITNVEVDRSCLIC